MGKFNLHAVATGMLADMLSQEAPVDYPEGAFTAGLFHDLGRLLIAIGLPGEYEQVAKASAAGGLSLSECEAAALGFTSADLSAEALEQWNLPQEIRAAVLYCNNPEMAPSSGGISLSKVIQAADGYVNAIGYQIDEGFPPPIDKAIVCLEALGLGRALPSLLEAFAAEFEAVRILF